MLALSLLADIDNCNSCILMCFFVISHISMPPKQRKRMISPKVVRVSAGSTDHGIQGQVAFLAPKGHNILLGIGLRYGDINYFRCPTRV